MKVPPQTYRIFELLSKGQFICSNSTDEETRKLYSLIDDENNFENLYDYFSKINFKLEKGDEYFYFSRVETKVDLERKITRAYQWIDLVDFFKTFDNSFSTGTRISPHDILVKINTDIELEEKLTALKKYAGDKEKQQEIIEKLFELMEKDTFMEVENSITNTYKVLSSFKYLEELILTINLPEEANNEKFK